MTHRVFSYGTLRQPEVQLALYGREVHTVDDVLPAFRIDWIEIVDQAVIDASGSNRHPILRRSHQNDEVAGAYLEISDVELAATDDYEVDDYVRVKVALRSGVEAWVYVADECS